MAILGLDADALGISLEHTAHSRRHSHQLVLTVCETFIISGIHPVIWILSLAWHQFAKDCQIRSFCIDILGILSEK